MAAKKVESKVESKKAYYASEQNLSLIRACVEGNAACLLIGETGTGKTTLVREVAKEHKKQLIRISVNGSMGVEEILGKWLVEKGSTKWQDGVLTAALREGHWVVMDEINAALPEILFTLHSLLDDDRTIILPEKDNELVKPHDDFRFFATMNPPEEYAGTKDMNKALVSRFTAVINVPVLDEVSEVQLLEDKGAKQSDALKLVSAARVLREAKKKDDIYYFCSTRDLVQCSELMQHGIDIADAFHGAVINKMSPEEYDGVKSRLDVELAKKVKLPTKSLSELIAAVVDAEKKLENQKKELEAKYAKDLKDMQEKLKKEAADEVSTDFIQKLEKLAKK